ncbi:MAG TPA: hypothetical protein DEG88_11915 [Propionibacteriaceae bacterium]|nr:hypothetical protein [Propionibacteriaceae bacterium]HBY23944.1 hypothetical protein [Propionibacteriaceae bacterium]
MGASTFVFSMIWVRQSDDTGGVWFECLPTTAPPDTLLGMVQRGRGAGWLAAVADPVEGRAALLACLTDDPRWDHQVESRAEFYASLAVALEVSAADIAACGDINDEDHWLVAETLTALSVRGDSNARELLAQRIPDTWFEDLMAEPTLPFPPLNAPLSALLGNEHLVSHHDLMHRLRTTTDPDDLAALHEATRDPNRRGFRSAMLALAERGDTSFVTQVGDILAGNPVGQPRAGFLGYLPRLPARDSLPIARLWFGLPDSRDDAALQVLALHATAQDVSAIRARLAVSESTYDQCDLVEALGRVPECGPYPELRTVFTDACYSYLRRESAQALATTDPDFANTFATECLWDCEAGTREVGAKYAPATEQVQRRLAELAADEDEAVRDAARRRLVGPPAR